MSIMRINSFDFSTIPNDTVFVLDTNVLYYVHSGYLLSNCPECLSYSNLIQDILAKGYTIKVSSLSIQELLFSIENKEYQLYLSTNKIDAKKYSKKDYRRNPVHRENVKTKFKTVLMELNVYAQEDATVNLSTIHRFVNTLEGHLMDPIDYLLSENFDGKKTIFISNDKDFQSLSQIQVLTA